jgi:phospholipase C
MEHPMTPTPIKNVVLLLLENHSFDNMLGGMPGVDGVSPSHVNVDPPTGNALHQLVTTKRQMLCDPKHDLSNVATQLENGNGGFVKDFCEAYPKASAEDRQEIMNYYKFDFLPGLHSLARDFTVCDRWFSSMPGPTWPNRFFALTGTSNGQVKMPEGIKEPDLDGFFDQTQVTIFDRLNEAAVSWNVYYYDFPSSLLLTHQRLPENLRKYKRMDEFYVDVQVSGQLPRFSLIEPKYFGVDQNDDHPPHNVMKAEKLIADVYTGLRSSPHWESTLLVIYYDEHGGYYDHVVPPAAVPPDDKTKANGKSEYDFNQLGIRVPAVIASPWVGRRVDSTIFDHTSLLRFLQEIWGLGSLGSRTAAAQSLSCLITEVAPRTDTIPFIRVPNTELIPDHPEWEKRDASDHHAALAAFSFYLSRSEGMVMPEALQALERGAGWWVKVKATLGEGLVTAGNWMMSDLEKLDKQKTQAVVNQVQSIVSGSKTPT